jgi:hypothetical protein
MKTNLDCIDLTALRPRSASTGGATTDSPWRYERKFVARGVSVTEVLALIRRHPSVFLEVYPSRTINNVYLDSAALHDYYDHVSGAAQRLKTRIRWYGPLRGPIEHPTLEQKIKRGHVNAKQSYPLPPLHLNGSIDRNALAVTFGQAGLPELVGSRLRQLEPSLINRYQRHYLRSADRKFRLTVDAALKFYPARSTSNGTTIAANGGSIVILELKFEPQYAEVAAAVTNALPFRLNRCSKYVLGIEQLHGT